jgi:magnesium-transporting ATPase (P-type)
MTSPEGLTSREARRRLGEFGPNAVAEDTRSLGGTLLAKFWAPVPRLLEAAIVLQVWLGQYVESAVVGGLLAFNATLALAARASSEADQDPIDDAAIRRVAGNTGSGETAERLVGFVPFDPATKMSEAIAIDRDGNELRIAKGALQAWSSPCRAP